MLSCCGTMRQENDDILTLMAMWLPVLFLLYVSGLKDDGAMTKDAPSRKKVLKDVRGTLQDIKRC